MGLFDKKPKVFVDDKPVEGRPSGSEGTTGLLFNGWYAVASQSLLHASRDDDPRCQKVLCLEAKIACKWANHAAKNPRQEKMCEHLNEAILELYELALASPPLEKPHDHPLD